MVSFGIATCSDSQEGQFAPIGEGLHDDVGLMRASRKGAGKAAPEVDYNNADAGIHG